MHLIFGHAEDFETERAELLKRVESCVLQRAEQHKLEAEARRRVDEVRELQKVCPASFSEMNWTCSSASPSSLALVAHGHAPLCS